MPIEVRPQILYNPTMRSPNFFVPGVIGVVLQIGTTFATAMAVVRERERGTLEQLLVSPLSRWGLMLGKLIPYLCIGMLMAILLFAIMRFVFAVPIAGSVIAMMLSTLVYVFALLSLGLLVATKAENQMQALQMSMTFIMPSVFFSGFIFPRETMPWIFYAIGALLPDDLFHRPDARHHSARRQLPRILALARDHVSDGGAAFLCLLAPVPEEDRLSTPHHICRRNARTRASYSAVAACEDRHVLRSRTNQSWFEDWRAKKTNAYLPVSCCGLSRRSSVEWAANFCDVIDWSQVRWRTRQVAFEAASTKAAQRLVRGDQDNFGDDFSSRFRSLGRQLPELAHQL